MLCLQAVTTRTTTPVVVFCVLYIYFKKHKWLAWSRGGGGGGGRGLRPGLHFGGERELHRLFSADYVV